MGIKGLLPFLSNAIRPGDVSEFEGKRVAIDVSCLLHRGVFGCVEEIAHGIKSDFCIQFIMKYIRIFVYYKCQITMVFDGTRLLPAKRDINDARKVKRDSNQRISQELIKAGKNKEAYEVMRKGIGVPKDITADAIKYFTEMDGIEVIQAPFEADAQLAYLSQNKLVDVVVTQDSDLIVYGCDKIIFKLETSGDCKVFESSKLKSCFSRPISDRFDFSIFRRMCILAGCDYLDGGMPGVGLKKAAQFFAKTSVTDPRKFLPRVPGFFNLKSVKVDKKFIESFIRAEHTFLHQMVFDPISKIEIPLQPFPISNESQCSSASSSSLST